MIRRRHFCWLPLFLVCGGCVQGGQACEDLCIYLGPNLEQWAAESYQGDLSTTEFFNEDGSFNQTAYEDACGERPEAQTCQECTDWHFRRFQEPLNVAGSCYVYFNWDSLYWEPEPGDYEFVEEGCGNLCRDFGLTFE